MRKTTDAELLSLVSHELRTPLTRLRWSAESLLDPAHGRLSAHQRRAAEDVLRNADELGAALEMLFEGATVALGAGKAQRIPFSLPYLVSHVIKEHPAVPAVTVSKRFAPAVPQVDADPKGMETAVRLLLSAACAVSVQGKLVVRIGASGKSVHCAICPDADPGPGFCSAFRGRPGRGTMDASPIPESHRLRFYVAQSLIRASGGSVHVPRRSGPAPVSFSLPRAAASSHPYGE